MIEITMTAEKWIKKENTKTVWVLSSTETKIITDETYNNIVGAKKFFQALGGYERHEMGYTYKGYKVVNIVSISPNKQNKSTYKFEFNRLVGVKTI